MYHVQYLTNLCLRRQWPSPRYDTYGDDVNGWKCTVRVNNREYHTEKIYQDEVLAQEGAAMRAYLICRDESQFLKRGRQEQRVGGVPQGMPVAIGRERRPAVAEEYDSFGSQSGGSSPSSYEDYYRSRDVRSTRASMYGPNHRSNPDYR